MLNEAVYITQIMEHVEADVVHMLVAEKGWIVVRYEDGFRAAVQPHNGGWGWFSETEDGEGFEEVPDAWALTLPGLVKYLP